MSTMRPPGKAVIPAAGLGTRFLPAAAAAARALVPVFDRPTVQSVLEKAGRPGVADAVPMDSVVFRGRRHNAGGCAEYLHPRVRLAGQRPDRAPDLRTRLQDLVAGPV